MGGNNIAKFIDYQILPDQLNIFIANLTVIFTIKKGVPTCFDFALWPLMLKVAKSTNTICGACPGVAGVSTWITGNLYSNRSMIIVTK